MDAATTGAEAAGAGLGLILFLLVAILISAAGVVCLSMDQANLTLARLFSGLAEKPTLIGLLSAALLGASSVFYRGGALALGHDNIAMAAGFTLAVSVVLQTLMMGAWMLWRTPGELAAVFRHWRVAGPLGIAGALCSICWFTAFTIQNATYVRAVGQIELVFTFLGSYLFFKETSNRRELAGIAFVIGSIVLLIMVI